MMRFNKTEKLLLFAFGCSDRAETFCRLGAASGVVQCEPFTEQCEALRKKLQVHQEPEENGLMSLSDYDRVCPFIEMGKSILLAVCFDEEIKVTLERIETIRENLTDLILKNAADEIYEDLYSLNDNEPWFYPEFMARHSAFAKTLYHLLQQIEEKHCCGCCKHNGAAHGKGGCSCGD